MLVNIYALIFMADINTDMATGSRKYEIIETDVKVLEIT
jgi:hypothetical protein